MRLLLVPVALLLACTGGTSSIDSNVLDAGGEYAGDSGVADSGTSMLCASWCDLQAECRAANYLDELDARLTDKSAACAYPDPAAARAECVASCERAPPGSACLQCEISNLEIRCQPGPSDCNPICGSEDDVLQAIRFDQRGEITCWATDSPSERPPLCARSSRDPSFSAGDDRSFSGLGTVLSSSPTRLELMIDAPLELTGSDLEFPMLTVGATIAVEIESRCHFICDKILVLRDEAGVLLFAAWYLTTMQLPPLPELARGYDLAMCSSIEEGCAHHLLFDLLVSRTGVDQTPVRIASGEAMELDPFLVVNGRSSLLFDINCTDTAAAVRAGYVLKR